MPEISRIFRSSFPDVEFTGFRTAAWAHGVARSADELRPLVPTLLHAFAHAAKADDQTGITLLPDDEAAPVQHRSWRALYHDAMHVASGLIALGVAPGDAVLLALPTSFELVTAFFAIQMAGAVPVPAYPPAVLERAEQALERLGFIARRSGAKRCVTNRALQVLLGGLQLGAVHELVTVEALAERAPGKRPRPRLAGSQPAFIQYTSGSTGAPKGVLLSHANVVANIHAIGQAIRLARRDVVLSWLPLYHDMGLIGGLLTPIYWRLPLVLMSPLAFLDRPTRWLEAITRYRATLSPAPNFAYALAARRVTDEERGRLDLSAWRVALNGAEPVNAQTLRDFERAFGPCGFRREAMLPVYGLAEASLAVAFPEVGTEPRSLTVERAALASGRAVPADGPGAMTLVAVGGAIPGHEVFVVDAEGAPVAEREVGHIVVRGPSVMQGYFRAPDATAKVLKDGALWTGDLGFLDGDALFVTGRAKDLIIVRGRNYYAEDLERVATRVPGARPGGVVAFGVYDEAQARDLVVIACETKLTDEAARIALVERLAASVSEHSGLPIDEVVLLRPGAIPKTSSGKPQRSLTRTRYLSGKLDEARPGKLRLALVFARSGAGFIAGGIKRLLGRREPA